MSRAADLAGPAPDSPALDSPALDRAAWGLVREAAKGGRRIPFLRAVTGVLRQHVGVAAVELWLEEGALGTRWRDPPGDQATPALATFRAGTAGPGVGAAGIGVEAAFWADLDPEGTIAAAATRGPGDSRWADLQGGPWSSLAVLPFDIDARDRGLLCLADPRPGAFPAAARPDLVRAACALGAALATRRVAAAQRERVKELDCLYRIARLRPALDMDEALQRVVDLLPAAWQYPEATTARIRCNGQQWTTPGFVAGPHRLAADIRVEELVVGEVEVFYVERGPDLDELRLLGPDPFLAEERSLVQGVAREVGIIAARAHAAETRRRLEGQVRHADRLATIGQLSAGVAHELNEPLGNVLGFAQLARKEPGLAATTAADLDKIVQAALYGREIVKKLMLFSRQEPARMGPVCLDEVIADGMLFLEARCRRQGITVSRDLAGDLPAVHADPAQLRQVLVNLVVNALQAMPDGGRLALATARVGDRVTLAVSDTGQGMSPEVAARIFEPFFTTKDVGEGTGLGLAVVHGIVAAHGGSIRVASSPGRGSTFTVALPLSAPARLP